MDLVGLAFSKEKIDTAVAMATFVDGYTKVVLGSIGLVMSFGVVAGGSVAIPFLFLGIILAGVLKENELLKSVKKDITNLNNSIRHDEELLKYRIDTLRDALKKDLGEKATPKMVEEAIKNDPRAMYLALKISENQQKLQIRQAEEKSLQKTRSLMLYMGALSVGMLIASTFFPPASIAFAALGLAGLACFLLMNRLVAHEKQALNEEIKAIKTRPLATEQVLNTALGIKTVKPVFVPAPKTSYWTSVCSIFKKESKPIVNASHAKDIPKFALNY
ncbi:MAG: hypothetical protein JO131_06255 [Gammaproteobacteria bacterium]|nr:hypothetical protein [Gammaproteobacteria bacterium]